MQIQNREIKQIALTHKHKNKKIQAKMKQKMTRVMRMNRKTHKKIPCKKIQKKNNNQIIRKQRRLES